MRDPRDVALSSIGMGWASSVYYGVDHWLDSERSWDGAIRSVAADQIFTLKYESLFTDTEQQLRQVCQFLGLAFEEAMLRYHESTSYGPPSAKSIERWRGKISGHEVALLEGKAADLMAARGYDLSGTPAVPGPVEKRSLWWQNKRGIWAFGSRKFGPSLFWGEKLSRWLKLRRLNRKLLFRMHAIEVRNLK